MHTAIIGGTGLIGLATAQLLCDLGHRVTVISRGRPASVHPAVRWVEGDVTDAARLRDVLGSSQPDNVVHLAAYLQFDCDHNPAKAVSVNVDGTLNALEACRLLGIARLVFGSTIAVYGERHDLMREDDPPSGNVGLYGLTKRLGEMLGERYAGLYGLRFVALRYAGVFGPGRPQGAGMSRVRQLIKQTANGADVQVEGACGEERLHLTHVTDAARATVRALQHPAPRFCVYNVGGPAGNYISLRDFHGAVKRVVPGAGSVVWSGRGRSAGPLDTSRLREDLGCVPAVTVAAGLELDLRGQAGVLDSDSSRQ